MRDLKVIWMMIITEAARGDGDIMVYPGSNAEAETSP
jgi:hypothetical protein